MKLINVIKLVESGEVSEKDIILNCKNICSNIGLDWNLAKCIVSVTVANPSLAPNNFGGSKDNQETILTKWMKKIKVGYDNRPSQSSSTMMATVSDPLIDAVFQSRGFDAEPIRIQHRNSMKIEERIGAYLEEYIFHKTRATHWTIAWNSTLKSTDIVGCLSDGKSFRLIQVKNKTNSENSSSMTVRDGTSIEKWARLDADSGETYWPVLCSLMRLGENALNEEGFQEWTLKCLQTNPNGIVFEEIPESEKSK